MCTLSVFLCRVPNAGLVLIRSRGFAHHALSQVHHFDVGLLGKAFHVGDVAEAPREFDTQFARGEIGNPF